MEALHIVQRFFPEVQHVEDAEKGTTVEVAGRDNSISTRKSHKTCALAVACKRRFSLDGVIISVKTAYLVRGKKALRYRLPESVSREVVSFDRSGSFASGEYRMLAPVGGHRLGTKGGHTAHTGRGRKKIKPFHHTTGIRTVLGSKEE